MNNSRLNFADVALSWLLFPARIGVKLGIQPDGDTESVARRNYVLDDPVVSAFVDYIALRPPIRTLDEVQHVVTDFFGKYPNLWGWWHAILEGNRIDFFFDNGEPRVETPALDRWRSLSVKLDPDALIAFEFARRYGRGCVFRDLEGWGTVANCQSPEIRRLFLDHRHIRIYETHVHLEGCEPVPLLWQRVLSGELRPGNFEQYRTRSQANEQTAREKVDRELAVEMSLIGRSIQAYEDLLADYPWLRGDNPPRPVANFISANVAALWPERQFLTGAWSELGATFGKNQTASPKSLELARQIDVYTQGKSAFFSRLVQGPLGNPGLATFKRYFRRGKVLPKIATKGSKNPARATAGPSRRLSWERWCRMGRFATENRGLAGIEFRIAPFSRVRDYVRFFTDFKAERKRFLTRPDIDVSFIVHFIRQEPTAPYLLPYTSTFRPVGHGLHLHAAAIDDGEACRSLDRQSAVLHRFRMDYPDLAVSITGIDVANVERRNPVHLASAYLRLLRARKEDDLPQGLVQNNTEHFSRWLSILAESAHIVPTGMGPLGLTYHAGEDFFHPAEGIKAIWEYMNFCDVRSGDRIGHGLALGIDIPHFNKERGRYAVMPRGEALDLLVWVRHRLAVLPSVNQANIRKVDDDIVSFSFEVYGQPYPPHELYALVRARHGLRRDALNMSEDVAKLLAMERSAVICERRITYDSLPASLIDERIGQDLTIIQQGIVQEVIDRELYVEVNPSSNINILSLGSIESHPVLGLLKSHPALKLTVNTDDPGTFATSLELEYALVKECLHLNGMEGATQMLERIARASEQAAFSTPPHRRSP